MAHKYSEIELNWVKWHAALGRQELADKFNERFGTTQTAEQLVSLRKRKGWLTGRDGRFKAGQPKIPGSGAKTPNATSFKKGNRPANYVPVGTEIIDGDGYRRVKVADPNEWEFVHLRVWEQQNGPIPPGAVIRFLDGDKQNVTPGNLVKVSKAEHLHLNRREYNAAPDEIKPALLSLSKLEVKLFEIQRNEER
ncbi:TPA: HNH endonuclease [Enterobacter roggenkampii]|uniref:HNH endonuclease signature motif containing protein n=1 Tax=Enterobacter sp. CPE_E1241 TaxID=3376801 RepID=UPI0027EB204C|nr:HNH endonuclease [Enterobacter roggenkampii]